jgi:hypothetical protein
VSRSHWRGSPRQERRGKASQSRSQMVLSGAVVVPWPAAGQSGRLRVFHELRLDLGSGTQPPQASSACSASWAAPNARSYSHRRDQDTTVTWRAPISSLNLSSRLQQPQHEVTGEDVQLLL